MARDEQEEEREFLADLEARTGRTLSDWMAAIAAQGFSDKNETIDWLREQGIPFARASWLERIHSNGGKPIYLHQPPKAAEVKPPMPLKPQPAASRADGAGVADLDKLLAAGKVTGRSTSCWSRDARALSGPHGYAEGGLHLAGRPARVRRRHVARDGAAARPRSGRSGVRLGGAKAPHARPRTLHLPHAGADRCATGER
jgi:hypothetical protein